MGLLLKVEDLLPTLEAANYRLPFGFATVDLEVFGFGSKVGKETEPEEDEDVLME